MRKESEERSTDVRWLYEDEYLDEVMINVADSRIRRMPAVPRAPAAQMLGRAAVSETSEVQEAASASTHMDSRPDVRKE